ncbi:Asp23/Gls24 family envelope stress response protein [Microbacterium sp. 1P10UB]|uniref:Asp23/Gls24 family envelope stress response protein n=1 Tax=unclassified Microbacterium TaxID=2609290 RepID=UPI0039A396E0
MTASDPRMLACGKTIDELSNYLAGDREPYDPAIENCPECLNALSGLEDLSAWSRELLEEDGRRLGAPDESWIRGILDSIVLEVRAGRDLPVAHPDPRLTVVIAEGAVRALVRSVGGSIPGVVIAGCSLDGDVETPGAPLRVVLTMSLDWQVPAADVITAVRDAVAEALAEHTELRVDDIDISVVDVHRSTRTGEGS